MQEKYQESLAMVLVFEGGYVNHPKDPGGATNKGVTQKTYNAYRTGKGETVRSVKEITKEEIHEIYKKQYWDAVQGDKLPAGIDGTLFDGAVNSGPSRSVMWLQKALGVGADGVIGQQTLAALRGVNDHDALITKILNERMKFLKQLKTWNDFGKGWTKRVDQLRTKMHAWASGSIGPQVIPIPVEEPQGKALITDAKPIQTTTAGDTAISAGSATAVLAQAQSQLIGYTDVPFVKNIVIALTLAGIALAVGGFVYRGYSKRKAARQAEALDIGVPATA